MIIIIMKASNHLWPGYRNKSNFSLDKIYFAAADKYRRWREGLTTNCTTKVYILEIFLSIINMMERNIYYTALGMQCDKFHQW